MKITLLALILLNQAIWAAPFTYQGQLSDNGSLANNTYDLRFLLYDAADAGNQVASTQVLNDVPVTDGIFEVELDFGNTFDGNDYWLEVWVRPGASAGGYTQLLPRQYLSFTPNAQYAMAASDGPFWKLGGNTGAGGFIGTTDSNALELRVNNQRVGLITHAVNGAYHAPNVLLGSENNDIATGVVGGSIGGGGGEPISNSCGDGSQPCVNTVSGSYGTVAGGRGNYASGPYATVGGGYYNTASGNIAIVGGGQNNTASGNSSMVVGGQYNRADGYKATVCGGSYNTAIGGHSVVGGGYYNTASGDFAMVPGGYFNRVGGDLSFVAGYRARVRDAAAVGGNDTDGDEGTFVWADSTLNADFISSGPNQFLVRSNGGVWFGQTPANSQAYSPDLNGGFFHIVADGMPDLILGGGSDTVSGDNGILSSDPRYPGSDLLFYSNDAVVVHLNVDKTVDESAEFAVKDEETGVTVFRVFDAGNATLAGTLTQNSDRNNKEDIEAIDPQEVLAKVTALPLYRWSYKGEQARHIGPMAQDFHAAFGLGDTDKGIAMVDPDGVALAAIQALAQENRQQARQLDAQQRQIAVLLADREAQQQQLAQLQQALQTLQASQQQLLSRLRQNPAEETVREAAQ